MPGGDDVEAARAAADRVFRARSNSRLDGLFEPSDRVAAAAAVNRLGELFLQLPGSISEALERAREQGKSISSDRLQGVQEVVQNADDAGATEVRIQLLRDALLIAHDGETVRLPHVQGIATPWLSTKSGDARATGRFGVGLMTLRALSESLEFHSGPYSFRIGVPTIRSIDPLTVSDRLAGPGWTVVRVPLEPRVLVHDDLHAMFDRWDDTALLFLRHVSKVVLLGANRRLDRTLSLEWGDPEIVPVRLLDPTVNLTVQRAAATSGRTWSVYSAEVPSPEGAKRVLKAHADKTPIGIALARRPEKGGRLYAGLPLTDFKLPVRINAQFDPLANRQGIDPGEWNRALFPLIAEVWGEAVLHFFLEVPRAAWSVVPIDLDLDGLTEDLNDPLAQLAQTLSDATDNDVAQAIELRDDQRVKRSLADFAVEVPELEGVLPPEDLAELGGVDAALPTSARDAARRWRAVLDAWSDLGIPMPEVVEVADALPLLDDVDRPAPTVLALAAAAIEAGLEQQLFDHPFLTGIDRTRRRPPHPGSPEVLTTSSHQLADHLGIAVRLDPLHLMDEPAAQRVLGWLEAEGVLLDDLDHRGVLKRIATSGRRGVTMEEPLDDEQTISLRNALERIPRDEAEELGPDIGRAVLLRGFRHRGGKREPTAVQPAEAYLPKAIDREADSFAVAAGSTTSLAWLDSSYAQVLRSSSGRAGLGPQAFLRLLGAETAPRIRPHQHPVQRFKSDARLGVRAYQQGGPTGRTAELAELGASFTLDDHVSNDAFAVARAIAGERKASVRRRRAGALLASLGRAWPRLGRHASVTAAFDEWEWQDRGQTAAWWIWQLRSVAWLDDRSGHVRTPVELRIDSPASRAIYGSDVFYLHPDLAKAVRPEVLAALGVTGAPTVLELVDRLRSLQADSRAGATSNDETTRECAVVYRTLADRMPGTSQRLEELPVQRLRKFFGDEELVFSSGQWLPPARVFRGPPIFGQRRRFVPNIAGADPLWRTLQIDEPGLGDCTSVLRELGKAQAELDAETTGILLDTLRAMTKLLEKASPDATLARQMAKLALPTTSGWRTDRPVFVSYDPLISEAIAGELPLLAIGGEVEQFRPLLELLGATPIGRESVEVLHPDRAVLDEEVTEGFRRCVASLHDDLLRNDREVAESIAIPWSELRGFEVRIDSDLRARLVVGRIRRTVDLPAALHLDDSVLIVRDADAVRQVSVGGRAVGSLFGQYNRNVAHAWGAAWDAAQPAETILSALEVSQQQAAALDDELKARAAAFERQRVIPSKRKTVGAGAPTRPEARGRAATPPGTERVLVDPASVRLVGGKGVVTQGHSVSKRPAKTAKTQRPPTLGPSSPPQERSQPRQYSELSKESVGYALVCSLLGGDDASMVDLRSQHGVGADAVDSLRRFYELKVYAGSEPDQIRLEDSQVQLALTDPNFFLVVVSQVEGRNARPRVRVIVDPLKQLRPVDKGSITLSGVRGSVGVVYDFEQTGADDEDEAGDD